MIGIDTNCYQQSKWQRGHELELSDIEDPNIERHNECDDHLAGNNIASLIH